MSRVIFKWLHLSDIHFQQAVDSFNDARIQETLPDYIANAGAQCDTVIISGDFRFAPKKAETSAGDAQNYIKKLTSSIGVKDDRVVLVPGNHDLERSKPRENNIKGTRSEYDPNVGMIDKDVIEGFEKGFAFYSNVRTPFTKSLNVNNPNPHDIIDMGSCYLLLLNTAIAAGLDDDEHNIIVGSKYLTDLLDKASNEKPIIAVGHHGLNMYNDREKKEVIRYFDEKGIRLYLCGHEHDNGITPFSEQGRQVNVGCLKQGADQVVAGFSVGTLDDEGNVEIVMHKWDKDNKAWIEDKPNNQKYSKIYQESKGYDTDSALGRTKIQIVAHPFSIKGYNLIGGLGCDGIKYLWEKGKDNIVESLAFNERIKMNPSETDKHTSAYTISTSIGCNLSTFGHQCTFCQTGANNFFPLNADDIALQCIFMAEYDSDCPSYPKVRGNMREFAFMGQGEPGYNYDAVKRAIQLNDYAMNKIGQKISRYIISTCGITDFMPSFIEDCKNKVFLNPVTLHFSLNAIGDERTSIMPINQVFDYREFLDMCYRLYAVTGVKIGIGILLMVDYKSTGGQYTSLDTNKIQNILKDIDPKVFKIDLCTVNKTKLGSQHQLSHEVANNYLEIAQAMGFESKLFASFGDSAEEAGCGMLNSAITNIEAPGNTTIAHFNKAVELLNEAKQNV